MVQKYDFAGQFHAPILLEKSDIDTVVIVCYFYLKYMTLLNEQVHVKKNLNFQVAAAPDKWNGILNTTKNSKICMQTLEDNPFNLTVSEDCLYLNVYVPQVRTMSQCLKTKSLNVYFSNDFT